MSRFWARTILIAATPLFSIMASTYIMGSFKWGYDLPFYHIPTISVMIPFYLGLMLGPVCFIVPSLFHGGVYYLLNIPFGKIGQTSVGRAFAIPFISLVLLIATQIWYWMMSYQYGLEYQSINYMIAWGIICFVATMFLCIRTVSLFIYYRRKNSSVPNEAILNLHALIHLVIILFLFPYLGELL